MCNPIPGTENNCIAEGAGNIAAAAGSSAIDSLQEAFAFAVTQSTGAILSLWMLVPSPNPLTAQYGDTGLVGGGRTAPAALPANPELYGPIETIWESLWALTGVFAVLGIVWAVVQMVRQNSVSGLTPMLKMVLAVVAVSAFGVTSLWVLIQFSDYYAPWIMTRAAGEAAIGPDGEIAAALFTQEQFQEMGLLQHLRDLLHRHDRRIARQLRDLLRPGRPRGHGHQQELSLRSRFTLAP